MLQMELLTCLRRRFANDLNSSTYEFVEVWLLIGILIHYAMYLLLQFD